jgi:inosine-uridine nucleoside N-ribohydrolase
VTVITVGFLTNLFELLKTGPDTYSSLTGKDLVKQKVKKLVSMAGKFPAGGEFNVDRHPEASKYVFENWPTEIILSGFEIGQKIKTGLPLIRNDEIQNSPVKDVFRISIPLDKQDSLGRMSWDETAVLVGIVGYEPYYTLQRGKIIVSATDGKNTWVNDNKGTHYYLVEKVPPAVVEKLLNDMMMHQPRK